MSAQSSLPSPLAGEGAERLRREAGEGSSRKATARSLRSRMTDAERKLWFALKDRRFQGLKFRRQVPAGPYVADFLCYELRLVVEVDGGQHAESVHDAERDRWFADNGFRTLRFWNNDVLSNLEGVLTAIAEGTATPYPTAHLRSPPPSPARGEGKKKASQ
ncbi:endonuclease domain-containing protein [Nitrobacter sp. NHB1]|uniref:endonuclease domain-containing protein n=1 Tax=Nitrobacter sp. NHB1 TaxID=3119830 RepID=UPI002FFF19F4